MALVHYMEFPVIFTSSSLNHRWDDDMYVGDWSSTPSERVCLCRIQVHNWERYPDRHYFRPCPLTTCQMTTDRTRNQQSGFVRIESVAKCFCPLTTHHSMPRECPHYSSVSNRNLSCIHGKHCNGDSIHWLSYWDLFLDIPLFYAFSIEESSWPVVGGSDAGPLLFMGVSWQLIVGI